MEKPRPSSLAWCGIVAGVAAYDILCPKGETLSERLDPITERPLKRALLYTAVGGVALHLVNLLPERYDPIHKLSELKR